MIGAASHGSFPRADARGAVLVGAVDDEHQVCVSPDGGSRFDRGLDASEAKARLEQLQSEIGRVGGMLRARRRRPLHLPFLQRAFGTVPLDLLDWARCVSAASMVLWLREISRMLERRRDRHILRTSRNN
jgi:hypothetical protein